MTKHMGGREATKRLIGACNIEKDSYVLDVGCGVGINSCYMARDYGCKVTGIDLSEMMVKRSRERAARKKVKNRTEFIVADAHDLPFEDGVFDAVVCESVAAFSQDKKKLMNELVRVAKSGGYVGLNEVTWLETPPAKLAEYLSRVLGNAEFLSPAAWKDLLNKADIAITESSVQRTNALRQWHDEVRQMDPAEYFRAWKEFFIMFFTRKEVRKWMWDICIPPRSIFRLFRYFGYGLYVGRKRSLSHTG